MSVWVRKLELHEASKERIEITEVRRVRLGGRLRGEKIMDKKEELGLKFSPQYMLTPQAGTKFRVLVFSILFSNSFILS